jgi:DUF1009 family protein
MSEPSAGGPVAIFAGGGALPPLLAAAAAAQGRRPVVFAIAGEADPEAFDTHPVHVLRWGEIGRLFRLLEKSGCREAAFIGSIVQRPDFRNVRPDFGAVKLIPRILQLVKAGDDGLLAGVAAIFAEQGLRLVGPLDLAPDLALPPGCVAGRMTREDEVDVGKAAEAARVIGRLDIGQAAIAAAGRVVAVEDAGGTDMLLDHVAALRQAGRIPPTGGVLVKCMKPQQDSRLDVPTLGPGTAEAARHAGLNGAAGEAGRTLLAGRAETVEAFRRAGLFLCGFAAPENG